MGTVIRETRSVCPVCLRNLPARLVREAGARRVHFSKYGLAWQRYIGPDKQEMKGLRRIV